MIDSQLVLWILVFFSVLLFILLVMQWRRTNVLSDDKKFLQHKLQEQTTLYSQLKQRHSDDAEQAALERAQLSSDLKNVYEEKMSLSERFDLVQHILALKPPANAGVLEFARLIREDYANFAAKESSLADEAGALLDLQQIHHELELLINFPAILGKRILGVAGGFSSGKSEFINSFLPNNSVKLAVGINPVTVIPSYIVYSQENIEIRGYSSNGGSLELGTKLYEKLSHEYVKSFGFDLRSVMPYVSIQVPISQELFEHIALIDTPGYNPGAGDLTQSFDRVTATEYVKQCDALIWVINIKAGTLPASDRDFIEQTGFSGKDLYIVLNQADLIPPGEIQEIIEEVSSELNLSGIEFSGICAYSSTLRKYYNSKGEDLSEFIKRANVRRNEMQHLKKEIDAVFLRYSNAIERDIHASDILKKQIKRLAMAVLENGGTDFYKKMKPVIDEIKISFQDRGSLIGECNSLNEKFFECAKKSLVESSGL